MPGGRPAKLTDQEKAIIAEEIVKVANLLAANPGQLDMDFIRREWLTLADEKDPRYVRFQEMVENLYRAAPKSEAP